MKKALLLYVVLSLIPILSSAQTAEEVLGQYLEAKKQRKSFQADMNMSIYKGVTGTKAYESIDGVIARHKGMMYQSLQDMQMAIGEKFYIKLNKDQKMMAVGLSSEAIFPDTGYLDIELLSKFFEKKELKNRGGHWELVLTLSYIPNIPIQQISLLIKKTNLRLHKAVLLYSSLSDFSRYEKNLVKPVDFPRMEITYTHYNDRIALDKNLFTKNYYFTHTANKINPSQRFQDYEILLLK